MVSVILIEPQEPGNIGAVARAMANFGLKSLVLISPACDHLSEDARRRAVHAGKILENAKAADFSYLKKFDYLVGATSVMGTDYNIPRSPVQPSEFAERMPKNKRAGLLFGRESSGLTNKEIEMCDFVVTIPTSRKYAAMNISHAAAILFYELFKGKGENITDHVRMASGKDRAIILQNFNEVLDFLEFPTKEKKRSEERRVGKECRSRWSPYH